MYESIGLGTFEFIAEIIALASTTRNTEQIKTLRAELDGMRAELKLPPLDRDRRDAKGWKIQ